MRDATSGFRTWFLPGTLLRKTAPDVKADYLPLTWAQTARYLMETPFDVGLIQVSPADERRLSQLRHLLYGGEGHRPQRPRLLIAQVNPHMPRTFRRQPHTQPREIDILVEGAEPLAEYPNRPLDDIDAEIGRRIAELIPDGCDAEPRASGASRWPPRTR